MHLQNRDLRRYAATLVLAALISFCLGGCALIPAWFSDSAPGVTDDPANPQPGTTEPDLPAKTDESATVSTDELYTWEGSVLEVYSGSRSFLAAVDPDFQDMLGDKAWVQLYEDACVFLIDQDEDILLQDVPPGSLVKVTITSGIRESYPVQVSAVEVRVTLR